MISRKAYSVGKKRIKGEVKRIKYAAQVASLENKLNAITEAYDSGVISKESYIKGKVRIERALKK